MSAPEVEHRVGDKVKMRSGNFKGLRGVIQAVDDQQVEVQLDSGLLTQIEAQGITNYSLAARKAWHTMRTS